LDDVTILENPTGTTLMDFSRINPELVRVSSPMFFMSYAESELLTAEAALRGWGGEDAASHYENGVRAAMHLYMHYDASMDIADADIDSYLANNPLDVSNGMRQIGWQYWAATLLNEYEAYSNYRRTGFPDFNTVDYPGNISSGQVPVRLAYPTGGIGFENFDNALSAQNMSNEQSSWMTVPVWWDR